MCFPSFLNHEYSKNLNPKLPVSSNQTSQLTSIYLPINTASTNQQYKIQLHLTSHLVIRIYF